MMNDEKLDSTFRNTFSDKKLQEEDRWDEFEVLLYKKMFYKYTWNRFNIYYLSMLLTCFVFSTTVFVRTVFMENDLANTKQTNTIIQDSTAISKNSIEVPDQRTENELMQKTIAQKTITTNQTDENRTTIADQDSVIRSAVQKDSISAPPVTTEVKVLPTQPVVLKRKKTVYVTKRDTIVQIDTVTIKKRK